MFFKLPPTHFSVCVFLLFSSLLHAAEVNTRLLPTEYESVSTQGTAMAGGGAAVVSGIDAVRQNPARIAMEQKYEVSGTYQWPTIGRDFYRAGIVDAKTSAYAAGIQYTGFLDKFDPMVEGAEYDSTVARRLSLALAQQKGSLSYGLTGQYVEAFNVLNPISNKKVSGITLGLGTVYVLNQSFQIAAAVENMANAKVKEYAPRTIRAGGVYVFNKSFAMSLDYTNRERIPLLELPFVMPGSLDQSLTTPAERRAQSERRAKAAANMQAEQLVIGGFTARLQQYLRLMGGYGKSITNEPRDVIGGGAALMSDKFAFVYAVQKPTQADSKIHQSVQMNLAISM
jgi:hypothetical protein